MPRFTINQARALFDADAYQEILALVARAERSVRLEFFLFGGPLAHTLIDCLVAKKERGVSVRLTLDRTLGLLPLVRRECKETYRRLRAEKIDTVLSDPRPLPHAPGHLGINHNKFLVVDDNEALVGGMNIGSLFFRHHDLMIHLKGPAAAQLGQQFDFDRQFTLDRNRPLPQHAADLPTVGDTDASIAPGESQVRVLGTGVGRRTTAQAIRENLRTARASVCVAMSEIGRTSLLDELIAVHQRGVRVRLLIDPQNMESYLPPALGPLRRRFPRGILNAGALHILLAAQVPVRLYPIGKDFDLLHQKTAIFDHQRAIVGSTNWTRGGFEWVGETDVELRGGSVIEELLTQFDKDWQNAAPALSPSHVTRSMCRLYERFTQ